MCSFPLPAVSHRVKVLDDTHKMIAGLRRQHRELQQKLAAHEAPASVVPDLTSSRALYMSVCLSALVNKDMHPQLCASGIYVYRSDLKGLMGDASPSYAHAHGYTCEQLFTQADMYTWMGEIAMEIEHDEMDVTQEMTHKWMRVMDEAKGTEQVKPKPEAWWK